MVPGGSLMAINFDDDDYPAIYNAADTTSITSQRSYFFCLLLYLISLISASYVSYMWPNELKETYMSLALFVLSIGCLIWLGYKKYETDWYNSRAVAESVKTRTWRWIMRAEPYNDDQESIKEFTTDLKEILNQNTEISKRLSTTNYAPDNKLVSDKMLNIRQLSWDERLAIYRIGRIDNQAEWYSQKAKFNKCRATQFLIASVLLNVVAICMLIYRINHLQSNLPVSVIATLAGAFLTWVQAKKYGEQRDSYSLAAHEIYLMKGDISLVKNDEDLSTFVLNSEAAFSREHTQWIARKSN